MQIGNHNCALHPTLSARSIHSKLRAESNRAVPPLFSVQSPLVSERRSTDFLNFYLRHLVETWLLLGSFIVHSGILLTTSVDILFLSHSMFVANSFLVTFLAITVAASRLLLSSRVEHLGVNRYTHFTMMKCPQALHIQSPIAARPSNQNF